MDRILFGDNQFFGVNHVSDEKSRSALLRFKDDNAIVKTIGYAYDEGVSTFMCTTHERMGAISNLLLADQKLGADLKIYPCLPYAHKYANAVTEYGIAGVIKKYVPGNYVGSFIKGGMAFVSKDVQSVMELFIDAEMKMFRGMTTPVIFLQNVMTDLLLGLGMNELFFAYHQYIIKKYNAEPGFITMNLPKLSAVLEDLGVKNPIICSSVNIDGFRMSGGRSAYEKILSEKRIRAVAMQIFSGGSANPAKAIEYVSSLPGIESILFGASSKCNIQETVSLINEYDKNKYEIHDYHCSGS